MARLSDVVAGFNLIAKYADGGKHDVSVAHDVIYAGIDCKMTDEDVAKMKLFGWFWDSKYDCWARFV